MKLSTSDLEADESIQEAVTTELAGMDKPLDEFEPEIDLTVWEIVVEGILILGMVALLLWAWKIS